MKTLRKNIHKLWLAEVCPGCVEGYPECQLEKHILACTVGQDQLATIRDGSCPYRTNGTFGAYVLPSGRASEFFSLDLSDKAPADVSAAVAESIELFWKQNNPNGGAS